jgi:3-oxoacyl-[acyl-carrier protein] reductase
MQKLNMAKSEFNNKTVLVTGSSRGIGAEIAKAFAAEGAKLALHGRDELALSAVVSAIAQAGGTAKGFIAELTKSDEVEEMRSAIEAAFGVPDILILNAGANLTPPAALEEIPEEGWRRTIDVNLTATFLTIKSFLPGMKARKSGSIVTMASSAARMPNAFSPIAYGAAKAGIILMTQDLAAQAGESGIRVNCVAPATILTERNLAQIPAERRESIGKVHSLKRLGTPGDVAGAVLFLASERSAWITGVTLDIAGGYVMR